jgi:hypothetical protein
MGLMQAESSRVVGIPPLYSEGPGFISSYVSRLYILRVFVIFLSLPRKLWNIILN